MRTIRLRLSVIDNTIKDDNMISVESEITEEQIQNVMQTTGLNGIQLVLQRSIDQINQHERMINNPIKSYNTEFNYTDVLQTCQCTSAREIHVINGKMMCSICNREVIM